MRERIAALLKIRSGESTLVGLVTGILLAANTGGAIGSPGVEALFYSRFGVEFLPTMYIILGLVTPATSLVIAAILPRVRLEKFFVFLPLLMSVVLVGFRGMLLTGGAWSLPVLWLGMNIMWTLQTLFSWGLAGLVCDARQTKRLFPLFVVGGILGMTTGSFLTGPVVRLIGAPNLILVWAGALLISFALAGRLMATSKSHVPVQAHGKPSNVFTELGEGLRYIRTTDLLRWLAIAAVFFAVLFYGLTFPFARAVAEQFPDENNVATFLGTLQGVISGLAMLASLLIANRLYARLGFMAIILGFPLLYLAGFTLSAVAPVFAVLVAFRFAQLFWLYGVFDGALQAMFNVIPPEHREKSRTFIQGVANPSGISLAGVLLLLAERFISERLLFAIGTLMAAWLSYLVWRAKQAYGPAVVAALQAGHAQIFFGEETPFGGFRHDSLAVETALKAIEDPNTAVRRIAADILGRLSLPVATDTLVEALHDEDPSVRVALLKALGQSGDPAALLEVAATLDDPHPEVRRQAIETLTGLSRFQGGLASLLKPMLDDPEPAVNIKAAASLLQFGAHEKAEAMLLRAASIDCYSGDQIQRRVDALEALAEWKDERALDMVIQGLGDPQPAIRRVSAQVMGQMGPRGGIEILIESLADEDRLVLQAAAAALGAAGKPALAPVLEALSHPKTEDGALLALEHLPARQASEKIKAYAVVQQERGVHYRGLWLGSCLTLDQLLAREHLEAKAEEAGRLVADSLYDKALLHSIRALKADGLLGQTEAITLAIEDLDSKDSVQQANAIETLDSLGDPRIVRRLLPLWEANGDPSEATADWLPPVLADEDPWLRSCGALASVYMAPAAVSQTLVEMAQGDPDAMVRECAISALLSGGLQDGAMGDKTGPARGIEFHGDRSMDTLASLSVMERILFLRRVPLFAELSPGDLKQIASAAGEQHFSDGTIIAAQGETGDVMHIIVEGQVEVTARVDDGSIRRLAIRQPGQYVGEMAILSQELRMATLTAVGNVRTLYINKGQFEETLRLRPDTSLAVIKVLIQRLRDRPVI